MRKNWLLIGVGLLVAVLAIGAIACSDDDDNGNGDGNGDDIGDIGDGNGNGNGDLLLRLSVTLTEMDGSGASGTAELTVSGEGIQVTLSMAGLQDGVHASHIHDGTCDDIGGIDISLTGIVGDEAGEGSQIDNNTENPLSHYETGHSLAVHEADGSPGTIISCGEIVVP